MIIIGRIFATLSFILYYKFFKDKNLLKNLKTAPNGLQYKEMSNEVIVIPIKQKFYFRILKETAWHQFCKKLGLGVEFQTGNLEFDNTYYIEADQKSILNVIQINDELKQVVIELARKGVQSIQCTNNGVLKIKTEGKALSDLFEELLKLKHTLDGVSISPTERDSFFQSAYFLEFILIVVGTYALFSIGSWVVDDGQTHLSPFGLFIPGVILGLLVVLIWILLASLLLKKSSRAPVLLFESLGTLVFTLIVAGPQTMLDLNQVLDTSKPEAVLAKIERIKEERDRRVNSRIETRSTLARFYIYLSITQNKYDIPNPLKVSVLDAFRFEVGQEITISMRQGFFDSPYIAGIAPAKK